MEKRAESTACAKLQSTAKFRMQILTFKKSRGCESNPSAVSFTEYISRILSWILETEQTHWVPRKHIYPGFNTIVYTRWMINGEQ